jgi:hypothetical protein
MTSVADQLKQMSSSVRATVAAARRADRAVCPEGERAPVREQAPSLEERAVEGRALLLG